MGLGEPVGVTSVFACQKTFAGRENLRSFPLPWHIVPLPTWGRHVDETIGLLLIALWTHPLLFAYLKGSFWSSQLVEVSWVVLWRQTASSISRLSVSFLEAHLDRKTGSVQVSCWALCTKNGVLVFLPCHLQGHPRWYDIFRLLHCSHYNMRPRYFVYYRTHEID